MLNIFYYDLSILELFLKIMLILVQWLMHLMTMYIVSSMWNFARYCIVWNKEKEKNYTERRKRFLIFHAF